MSTELFTFQDAVTAMDEFVQAHSISAPPSALRRYVHSAYRELGAAHDWSFLLVPGRIQLVAPKEDGTVAYDHADGATTERQLTLTDDTFPTDAANYSIRFDDIVCDIERYFSSTVVSLDVTMAPGADVASTTYSLWPRWYLLPSDFVSMGKTQEETLTWALGDHVSMEEMHALTRYETESGNVRYYSIGPAPDLYGRMALYVHPPSDAAETLDFLYRRRLRPLRYTGTATNDRAGTISMTSGSTTLTGTSTAFSSTHIGSIVRTAGNSTFPTSIEGDNPWVEQRSIIAVASTTSATLDAAPTDSHTDSKYCISDPIDLEVSTYGAFLWCARKHVAFERELKDLSYIDREYAQALFIAKGGDSRTRHTRVAGPSVQRRHRLIENTSREEVS